MQYISKELKQKMIELISDINSHKELQSIDIVTITIFFKSLSEYINHVELYATRINSPQYIDRLFEIFGEHDE